MENIRQITERRRRRLGRVRRRVRGTPERLRLTVFRSNKHIAAQIVNDADGRTLAAASTYEEGVVAGLASTANVAAAQHVGKVLAERARSAGIAKVAFDRGRYRFHGRVGALAKGAREGGLNF